MQTKTSTAVNTKRMLWADLMRIIAIYLVVQLHTYALPFNFSKITLISIPLFIMLSGALLLRKEENYQDFFFKRCIKVLIPWVIWTIIYMYYFLYIYPHKEIILDFFSDKNVAVVQWLHYFFRMFMSILWFLPLIFSLYLITPALRIFMKKSRYVDKVYLIVFWFMFISVIPFLYKSVILPQWSPNIVFTMIQYSGYFLLGSLLAERKKLPTKAASIVLLLVGFFSILFSSAYLDPRTVIASICFFLLIRIGARYIDKYINEIVRKIITKISGACLGIYVVQAVVVGTLRDVPSIFQSYNVEFLLTFIVFILATVITLILQKIPIIKYIVPR